MLFLVLAALLIVLAAGQAIAREPAREEAVKTAILFNFIRFVDWPVSEVPDPAARRIIATIGHDSLQEKIVNLVATAGVDSRISVLELESLDQLAGSLDGIQVLYVARSARKFTPRILQLLKGRSVLTVCDDEEFVHHGGMMNFVRKESRIRFDINLDEAERGHLKMSSKLFDLARLIVKNGEVKTGR